MMARKIVVLSSITIACICGCIKDDASSVSKQDSVNNVDFDSAFFQNLEKLSQDPKEKKRYSYLIGRLIQIVENEAIKDPVEMSYHIEAMMKLMPKAGPVVVLIAEECASAALQEEMRKIREDESASKILEKEKQIADLKKQIRKWEMGEIQKLMKESEIVLLNQTINQLKEDIAKKDSLISEKDKQLSMNVGEYLEQQKAQESYLRKNWPWMLSLGLALICISFLGYIFFRFIIDKYPVIIYNGLDEDIGIKVTRRFSGRCWIMEHVAPHSNTEWSLPVGKHFAQFFARNKCLVKHFVVRGDVNTYSFDGKWYHGYVFIKKEDLA